MSLCFVVALLVDGGVAWCCLVFRGVCFVSLLVGVGDGA